MGLAAEGAVDLDALAASGRTRVARNGLTSAGAEYQAHMGRGELPSVPGAALNAAGQNLVEEILTNPGAVRVQVTTGRFAGGTRFVAPNGVGATFDANGVFRYFGTYR